MLNFMALIYKNPYTLSVRLLCGSFLAAKTDNDTGYGLKRNRFSEDLVTLAEEDYNFVKQWVRRFAEIFGNPTRGSIYWSTTFFTACMYIGYQHQDQDDLDEKLRQGILGDEEVLEFGKFGGREANRKMIGLLQEKMRITPRALPWKPKDDKKEVHTDAK